MISDLLINNFFLFISLPLFLIFSAFSPMFSAFKPQKLLHTSHITSNNPNPSKNSSKLPQISNPSLIKLPILSNISQTLPLIDLPQNSIKTSQSNLIKKPKRSSFLMVNNPRNHKLFTQNSQPTSLHEKPFNHEENRQKLMNTLINLQNEQIIIKNPKIIDNFRAKFPKIQPLGIIPYYNEEKLSASTQATNPVSREGNENLEELITTNGIRKALQTKNGSTHIFKIRSNAPSLINYKNSSLDPSKDNFIVEKIQENESIILEDSHQKPSDDQFSDLHLINNAKSRNSSLEKHEILGKKIAWKQGDLIGYGSFGEVYRAMNCITGQIFAVKRIHVNKAFGIDKISFKEIQSELTILKQIHHPNIVNYYDFEELDDSLCIYFEYMSGGNISSLLKKYGPFPEEIIRFYSKQILSGLSYIHSRKVVHKDIKGANILVGNSGNVKLADFGSAQQLETSISISLKSERNNNNNIIGSVPWMAPEVVRQTKYGRKSDVWSFGCTVLEMITGNAPWSNYKFDNPIAAIMKIGLSEELPEIPKEISKDLKDFVKICLVRDQKKRCSVEELKKHPFLVKE